MAVTPVLSPGIARAAVCGWDLALSRGLGGSGGARDSQLFLGDIITGMFSEIHLDMTNTTTIEEYYQVYIKDKKTSAVRSRISSKLIFVSCVENFDRAHYGFYVTSSTMLALIEGKLL